MTNAFLSKGLFPKELPGCFSSQRAAKAASRAPRQAIPQMNRQLEAIPGSFSLARSGGVRRVLSIPNFTLHYHLAEAVQDNWDTLRQRMDRSPLTISYPLRRGAGRRAATPRVPWRQVYLEQNKLRGRGRFALFADISEWYRAIYTHGIAWAIDGKSVAQANPNDYSLVGNAIDRCIRNGQKRQTNGLPIGPDTSFVLGEVVLTEVDQMLVARTGKLRGFRFFDDYELVFQTRSEAEDVLAALQFTCHERGFHLNPTKTKIVPLPVAFERMWIHTLRSFDFDSDPSHPIERIVQFYDIVFCQKLEDPDCNVVTFALAKIERTHWMQNGWEFLQPLLYQAAGAEPAATQQLMRTLDRQFASGNDIDRAMLTEFICDSIRLHAPLGHSFEVCWCLWGALRFDVSLDAGTAKQLTVMWDDASAILALHAQRRGLIGQNDLNLVSYEAALTPTAMREEHWLLAYEATVRNWLTPSGSNPIAACPMFQHLRQQRVRFYSLLRRAKRDEGIDEGQFWDWSEEDDDDSTLDY